MLFRDESRLEESEIKSVRKAKNKSCLKSAIMKGREIFCEIKLEKGKIMSEAKNSPKIPPKEPKITDSKKTIFERKE